MVAVPIAEVRANLADVISRASNGESVLVTSRGAPQAVIGPVPESERPQGFSQAQLERLFNGGQMDARAWDDINSIPGGTLGDDGIE